MTRELTRRDAIAALSAVGASLAGCAAPSADGEKEIDDDGHPLTEHDRGTLIAAAEVLYPDAVEGIDAFVDRYVDGRVVDRPEHVAGVADAVTYLDEYSLAWYDADFVALSPADRDEVLRRMDVDEADPVPDGSDEQRLRYYVVNDLLLALYASPTGGRLVGIENPPGHPGGLASYQRGEQR